MAIRKNSIVFSPTHIGQLEIKNRLVRSATYESAATSKGEVSDFMVDLYGTLAKGGVGLIITGYSGVYSKALAPDLSIRADNDDFIASLRKIPQAVHKAAPDCRVMLQLVHPGRQVIHREDAPKLRPVLPPAFLAYVQKHPEVMAPPKEAPPVVEPTAPSAVYDATFDRIPRALTLDEINNIIDAFAEGARRAQEAGFDGVQLHAAHGYLLSTFLSPRTNQREDQYGGSTENRTRIIKEIYERARRKVGDRFSILIKINTTDFLPGGMDLNEAVGVGKMLSEVGFAALETSGGMWEAVTRKKEDLGWLPVMIPESRTGIKAQDQEAYFLPGAKALKEKTKATVILVGGLRSFSKIEEVLNSKGADLVSMSRPLIRQPNLPTLWRSGEGPDKAECISCNACLPTRTALACRAKMQS
ncbi:MAG: oxidase [Deltaproteobacteria bacterium]|jgi:2,4-dienoyl-CoA reductase-like NADH-dependent reductase (Old Yellow Enzyme family)|nr:oxidase [Deltaproteobacteria bacterium]